MSEPLVCAVMLVNGRPEMVRRAVASFRAQSYENKRLMVVNSGPCPLLEESNVIHEPVVIEADAWTIGRLRNEACRLAIEDWQPDVFVTMDSDDYSHPQRITEQVALLQSSGADCVGYREALFWDTRTGQLCGSWVYRSVLPTEIIGASMCYWRKTWERRPFEDVNHGEDNRFCKRCKVVGVSCFVTPQQLMQMPAGEQDGEPRIICSIHGGNTAPYREFSRQNWKRAPQLDEHCRKAMELK